MALSTGEIKRLRFELGYNVLEVGAEPYVTYWASLDRVIALYLLGSTTSSSTVVTAASPPTQTVVSLTLASVTGISVYDHVIVDVDTFAERATVRSISGSTISVALRLAHTGTYPVMVELGEAIVRNLLDRIIRVADVMSTTGLSSAGIKKVDEIEFMDGGKWAGTFPQAQSQLRFWRNELASALGVVNLREMRRGEMNQAVAY